ncbi:MAG: SRPBCC family protein [Cryobacterium sp.]
MRRLTIQTGIDLTVSAAEVFDFVADHTNAPQWQKGLHEVRRMTPGPLGVGTEHEFARRFAGMSVVSRNRFIEFEPGRFVAFEIPSGKITGVASYLVEPTGANTSRLISTVDFEVAGLARFATPLLARMFQRASERDEATLKALLEHTGIDTQE